MKRIISLAALLFAAVSCQKDAEGLTSGTGSGEEVMITVSAGVPDENTTRMGLEVVESYTDETTGEVVDGYWNFTWTDGDAVGAWSESALSGLTMDDYDEEYSSFKGSAATGTTRLVYSYKSSTSISDSAYPIDLSDQSVNFTTDVYTHFAENNLYMISDEFEVEDVEDGTAVIANIPMKHVTAAVVLQITNKSNRSDLALASVTIKGLNSSASIAFDGLTQTTAKSDIELTVSGASEMAISEDDDDDTFNVPFAVIPTTFDGGDVTVKLTFTDGCYSTITKTPTSGLSFAAGTYNTISCDIESLDSDLYSGNTFADSVKYSSTTTTYTISDVSHLIYLAKLVNVDGYDMSGCTFNISTTISLANYYNKWIPIGTETTPFKGTLKSSTTYDRTIANLTINSSDDYQGLFGYVGEGATIKNLILTNVIVKGASSVGGVVGYAVGTSSNRVTISDCTVSSGSVTGSSGRVGGVVGWIAENVTVANCSNKATIESTATSSTYVSAGGIVGYARNGNSDMSYVVSCSNSGSVSGRLVGGIAGSAYGAGGNQDIGALTDDDCRLYIANCYNSGEITCTYTPVASATAAVSAIYASVGPICGWMSSVAMYNCYNTGGVSTNSSLITSCGGLTGYSTGCYFGNCYYVSGDVYGTKSTSSGYDTTADDCSTSTPTQSDLDDNAVTFNTSVLNADGVYDTTNLVYACEWSSSLTLTTGTTAGL